MAGAFSKHFLYELVFSVKAGPHSYMAIMRMQGNVVSMLRVLQKFAFSCGLLLEYHFVGLIDALLTSS